MLFKLIKLLMTLGPDVLGLIQDVVEAIKKQGASKDRKAAERVLYIKAWRIKNGVPDHIPFDNKK